MKAGYNIYISYTDVPLDLIQIENIPSVKNLPADCLTEEHETYYKGLKSNVRTDFLPEGSRECAAMREGLESLFLTPGPPIPNCKDANEMFLMMRDMFGYEEALNFLFYIANCSEQRAIHYGFSDANYKSLDTPMAERFDKLNVSCKKPAAEQGAMDVAMAAIPGGCNSVKSPAQINYYRFAIADMSKKAPGGALGATWTWSSNCKKALGEGAASGKIDPRTDACYAALPEDTTLGEIMDRFARGEPFFRTKKNDVVLICPERFADLLG